MEEPLVGEALIEGHFHVWRVAEQNDGVGDEQTAPWASGQVRSARAGRPDAIYDRRTLLLQRAPSRAPFVCLRRSVIATVARLLPTRSSRVSLALGGPTFSLLFRKRYHAPLSTLCLILPQAEEEVRAIMARACAVDTSSPVVKEIVASRHDETRDCATRLSPSPVERY